MYKENIKSSLRQILTAIKQINSNKSKTDHNTIAYPTISCSNFSSSFCTFLTLRHPVQSKIARLRNPGDILEEITFSILNFWRNFLIVTRSDDLLSAIFDLVISRDLWGYCTFGQWSQRRDVTRKKNRFLTIDSTSNRTYHLHRHASPS